VTGTQHDSPSVGDIRTLLERYGIPHTDDAHHVIVADAPDHFAVITCCDDVASSVSMLRDALANLTGETVPVQAVSDRVIVSRDDLRNVMTLIALWVPPEFRPSVIVDRLSAAVEAGR
jgi:hypothetical protein